MASADILLLCHTAADDIGNGGCSTAGIPITLGMIRQGRVSTLDVVATARPDFAMDLTRPIPRRLASSLEGRFDVVTTACCNFDIFVAPGGKGLVRQAWDNVLRMLKPGGFFLVAIAPLGVDSLAAFLEKSGFRVGKRRSGGYRRSTDVYPRFRRVPGRGQRSWLPVRRRPTERGLCPLVQPLRQGEREQGVRPEARRTGFCGAPRARRLCEG